MCVAGLDRPSIQAFYLIELRGWVVTMAITSIQEHRQMAWFSRLIQKNHSASQRRGNRRRQVINMERLETRVVLSDVTVTFPAPGTSSTLLIQGDTFNDNFVITENANGSVTVSPGATTLKPGAGFIPGSTVNTNASPISTNNPVSAIVVQLPGTNNFDIVNLNGPGSPTVGNVTVSASAPNLTFNVGVTGPGVSNRGALTVTDTATTNVNGVLLANVQNSTFTSIAITQFGNGPDFSSVRLANDVAPGPVAVTLGNANSDSITLLSDRFGPTTLNEGAGGPANPLPGSSLGNSDTITVTGGQYTTLFADQLLNGTHNSISISNIQVANFAANSPNPAGVTTIQHDAPSTRPRSPGSRPSVRRFPSIIRCLLASAWPTSTSFRGMEASGSSSIPTAP